MRTLTDPQIARARSWTPQTSRRAHGHRKPLTASTSTRAPTWTSCTYRCSSALACGAWVPSASHMGQTKRTPPAVWMLGVRLGRRAPARELGLAEVVAEGDQAHDVQRQALRLQRHIRRPRAATRAQDVHHLLRPDRAHVRLGALALCTTMHEADSSHKQLTSSSSAMITFKTKSTLSDRRKRL